MKKLKESVLKTTISLIENGKMPDPITRIGIRKLLKQRLNELDELTKMGMHPYLLNYADGLRKSPLAIMTKEANEQHYEVPTQYYDLCLGAHKKYSSCYWDEKTKTLEEAEALALDMSIKHAQITDGMRILELGCGWGSLSLELAKRFPQSKITVVSNSKTQKQYIDDQAKLRGFQNIEVLTRDLSLKESYDFGADEFDRVMSIEMMEHLRNYQEFFKLVAKNVKAEGLFFIHIFTHKTTPYYFETEGDDNWMGKYFFSGGQMPSRDLFAQFSDDFQIKHIWDWNGVHYQKTLEAWLKKMDDNADEVMTLFKKTYGEKDAVIWFNRWRIFYLACSELFGFDKGETWGVTHYLLSKNSVG